MEREAEKTALDGAWYAKRGGKWRELYTILHLPYTSMVLSYVVIGAALAPILHLDRLALTLLAYFLGLGFAAHALNELRTRHWGEALSRIELKAMFIAPLLAALAMGAYGIIVWYGSSQVYGAAVLTIFVTLETIFLFAYNLGYSKFHSDLAFAFSWAALPFLTSYFVNSVSISLSVLFIAAGLAATAAIEINLSRWCKDFRRNRGSASQSGSSQLPTTLLIGPERALKLVVVTVNLLAVGLFIWRLIGG
jgi:nitrate reductase NapE component